MNRGVVTIRGHLIQFTVKLNVLISLIFLISYYSLFISITYVIVRKMLFFILSIIYFDYVFA